MDKRQHRSLDRAAPTPDGTNEAEAFQSGSFASVHRQDAQTGVKKIVGIRSLALTMQTFSSALLSFMP